MPGNIYLSVTNCQQPFLTHYSKKSQTNLQNVRKRKGPNALYLGIKVLLSSASSVITGHSVNTLSAMQITSGKAL